MIKYIKNLDNDTNPLENLIKVSKELSDKYKEDITSGNITIEDLMGYIYKCLMKMKIIWIINYLII